MKAIVAVEILSGVHLFDVVCVHVRGESWRVDLKILDDLLLQVQMVEHKRENNEGSSYQVEYVMFFKKILQLYLSGSDQIFPIMWWCYQVIMMRFH